MNPGRPASHPAGFLLAGFLFIALCLPPAVLYHGGKTAQLLNSPAFDMSFFIHHGRKFFDDGQLFQRPTTANDLAAIYAPSGCCSWKYPPIGEVLLLPYIRYGIGSFTRTIPHTDLVVGDPSGYFGMRLIDMACYAIACLLLMHLVLQQVLPDARPAQRRLFLLACSTLFIAADPYYFLLDSLNYEILMYLLVVMAIAANPARSGLAGSLLGFITAIKLYPAVLLLVFVAQRDWRGSAFFVASFVAASLLAVPVFGWQENRYFWFEVFPVMLRELPAALGYNLGMAGLVLNHAGADYLPLFTLQRLLALLLAGVFIASNPRRASLANVSAGLIAMLLFLKNYWSAYQVFLLVPSSLVAAEAIRRADWRRGAGLVVLFILYCLDFNWLDDAAGNGPVLASLPPLPAWTGGLAEAEASLKSWLFPQPGFRTALAWGFACKALIPWALLYWLFADRHSADSRTA